MRTVAGCVTTCLALALSGIAFGSSSDPKTLVLKLREVPSGFRVYKAYYQTIKDASAGNPSVRAEYERWGFLRTYLVNYVPGDQVGAGSSFDLPGAQMIESSASVYESVEGAHESLSAAAAGSREAPYHRLSLAGMKIGSEAFLYKEALTLGGDVPQGLKLEEYCVSWRHTNLRGSICVTVDGGSHAQASIVSFVTGLAKRQDAQMS